MLWGSQNLGQGGDASALPGPIDGEQVGGDPVEI